MVGGYSILDIRIEVDYGLVLARFVIEFLGIFVFIFLSEGNFFIGIRGIRGKKGFVIFFISF